MPRKPIACAAIWNGVRFILYILYAEKSAPFLPGTCPGAFFLGRQSERLWMHRNWCGILLGLVPVPFFSFVYPGFCLCNCAVASATRLAGAVIETGDGLCGALLLSLRHLSTTSEPRRRGSGMSLRRDTIAAAVGINIGIRNPVLAVVATSIFRAVVCVRAEIARVSVGMLGMYRTFFICADGR